MRLRYLPVKRRRAKKTRILQVLARLREPRLPRKFFAAAHPMAGQPRPLEVPEQEAAV